MKKRILIVDDEVEILSLMREVLEDSGFEVETAASAKEFVSAIRGKRRPDLIILDIILGTEVGPQVYDQLLIEGFDQTVPVIFLSGIVDGLEMKSSYEKGRFALLGKPITGDELIENVDEFLKAA